MGPRDALEAVQRRLGALRRAVVAEVEDVNRLIYHVLRGGLVASLSFIVFAFLLSLAGQGPLPRASAPPREVLVDILRLTPEGLMGLGVLLLIFTPLVRVMLSLVSYARDRDTPYVVVTGLVLANLVAAFLLALA